MANNTERTLCFGFKSLASARPPQQQEKSEPVSVSIDVLRGRN